MCEGERGRYKNRVVAVSASDHFNPSFFIVLAKTIDKNIKTLTTTTLTTETVTKGPSTLIAISEGPTALQPA